MAETPKQLTLPGMEVTTQVSAVVEIGGVHEQSRSERIALECIADEEPFFVLRAKDVFSVMAVHNYSKLVEEYGPLDFEFHGAVSDLVQEMRKWQMDHPERVKYPD